MKFKLFVAGLGFALTLHVAGLQAGDFDPITFPSKDGSADFTMPSNNVECIYEPRGNSSSEDGLAEIQCDRAQPSYIRVVLGERGRPEMVKNPGEQPCCTADAIFPYGRSWHGRPFSCDSRADGLICTRDTDGHGFRVRKAGVELF